MSLNQRKTAQALSRLDWRDGLTREDIAKSMWESEDLDESDVVRLFNSLPEGRRFHSYEEAVDAVDPMNWEK